MACDYSKSNLRFPKPEPGSTHPTNPVPPADFRAQATGVGNTCAVSLATGRVRAEMVRSGGYGPTHLSKGIGY